MAIVIDGKKVSKEIKEEVKEEVMNLKTKGEEIGLAVVLVGDDSASKVYVSRKKKTCMELGINSYEYILDGATTQKEILSLIHELNNDSRINGILVQLPLPKHIDERVVLSSIDSRKDVDCFHPENVGKLVRGDGEIFPCTPYGIMILLKRYDIEVEGANCVIVGRSNIVGKPMSLLLLNKSGTVAVCHSKTKDLKDITKRADILVSAVGKPNLITEDYVKDGAVVIDVGINRMADGKLCGDVDYESVSRKVGYITPVPGGVGPMTIAMLMKNVVKLKKLSIQNKENA